MSRHGTQTLLRPIRTEEEHEQALTRVEELMPAAAGTPEADELEVLSLIVKAYEKEHHRIESPDPIAAVRFRMEQENLTRKDLEPILGTRARVSEVLSGRRNLTIGMIRGFKTQLGISADVLIGVPTKKRMRARETGKALIAAKAKRNPR